ncbi:MAG: hypothetical protein SV422_16465, partial [Pseudomonadota bacterium]|nr:hypothetical protein [Pseudomonadota bacterium]
GLDPWFYKATNIALHLLTTLVVYLLTREVLNIESAWKREPVIPRRYLALLITAAWALHPLHASTVLYVVQRMTQLAALFSFLAILLYCIARRRTDLSPLQILLAQLGIAVLIALGLLGKETAVLTVPLIAVIEFTLFGMQTHSRSQRLFQRSFLLVFLLVPGAIVGTWLLFNPDYILAPYATRDFSLYERVLSETRILWDYIRWLLVPDTRAYTFYYENYPASTGLLAPPSTLFALIGIAALVGLVFYLRKRLPWISFGIGFFLAGHALESTVIALELVFEHRNYVPAYGLLCGVIATLFSAPLAILSRQLATAFSVLFLALLLHGTYTEAVKWSSTPNFLLTLLNLAPHSYRVHYTLGHTYLTTGVSLEEPDYLREARAHFSRAVELDERNIAAPVGLIMVGDLLNEPAADDVKADFVRRIEQYAFGTSSVIALINLQRCYFSRSCDDPQTLDVYAEGLPAIARNPTMSVATKQAVLSELAGDLLLSHQRIGDALALYYMAADMSNLLTINDVRIIFLEMDRGNYEA